MRDKSGSALIAAVTLSAVGAQAVAAEPIMTAPPRVAIDNAQDDAREILRRYARSWRGEAEMKLRAETVIAFTIAGEGGGKFHVRLPVNGAAVLMDGVPAAYEFAFEADIGTLRKLDRGEWTAFTAMAQAVETDPTPLVLRTPAGFEWSPENRGYVLPLLYHFWNREWPEVVRFGEGTTRAVHGGNATPFIYSAGLRSSWYQVKAGMHINAKPRDQVNDFDSFVIVTRGAMSSRLDGLARVLHEGEAVLIPAGMKHEFWATASQYAEFVLLMFGGGA